MKLFKGIHMQNKNQAYEIYRNLNQIKTIFHFNRYLLSEKMKYTYRHMFLSSGIS